MSTMRDRQARYGITDLTVEERTRIELKDRSQIKYVGVQTFPEGFSSLTGLRGSKHAIVLRDENGEELLLTRREAREAIHHGIKIPRTSLTTEKKKETNKRELFA
jgi:hypothetical protein